MRPGIFLSQGCGPAVDDEDLWKPCAGRYRAGCSTLESSDGLESMSRRSDAIERFTVEAEASGLEVEVQQYPGGTRTAADAAEAVGCHVDQIVKSLVFMADVRPVLVLCSGGRRVDEERLASYLGTEIRIAGASEVRAATGFAIGGTPPLGHTVPLRTVVDPHLMDFDQVWAAAGTPDSVFPVKPKDLVKATGGAVVGVTR